MSEHGINPPPERGWLGWLVSPRAAVLFILLSWMGALAVGLLAREPMAGDEVMHYHVLLRQARVFPVPNVQADIPMEGWTYTKYYPHVFLWHYVGAMVWRAGGSTFAAVQVYQSLFWLQLLLATWLLARHYSDDRRGEGLVAVLGVASLPMALLFGVLHYQDVPATAQVVTSFLLLKRRRLWLSLPFMGLALGIKETTFVMLPIYFLFVGAVYLKTEAVWRTCARVVAATVVLFACCVPMAVAMKRLHWNYYPLEMLERTLGAIGIVVESTPSAPAHGPSPSPAASSIPAPAPRADAGDAYVPNESLDMANHPGDLRTPVNWVIFLGGVFWLLLAAALVGFIVALSVGEASSLGLLVWPTLIAGWYLAVSGVILRSSPDARFFIPAFPFLAVSMAPLVVRVPWRRVWFPALIAVALFQSGAVLWKTAALRVVPSGIRELSAFMQASRVTGNYFMYPEGHDRFIPGSVVWYMNNRLPEFWRGSNEERIRMLAHYRVSFLIIKKDRIRDVEPGTYDLGAYPKAFVDDIRKDGRFVRVFDNRTVEVYDVPPLDGVREGVESLKRDGYAGRRCFVYPGFLERFMPCVSEWSMRRSRRVFLWEMTNDQRLELLRAVDVTLLVFEKSRIVETTNVYAEGVYPLQFVKSIQGDPRFRKVLDNHELLIFEVPSGGPTDGTSEGTTP